MIESVYAATGAPLQVFVHPPVQVVHVIFGVIPAGDAGLVRDNDGPISAPSGPGDGLRRTGDPFEVLDAKEISGVDIQHAVTVKKDRSGLRLVSRHAMALAELEQTVIPCASPACITSIAIVMW